MYPQRRPDLPARHFSAGGRAQLRQARGERVYLVEYLAGPGAWDLSDRAPSALRASAISQGPWQDRGSFPVFSALTIHMPQDADDPAGVELEDGSVVVRDVNAGTWVLR